MVYLFIRGVTVYKKVFSFIRSIWSLRNFERKEQSIKEDRDHRGIDNYNWLNSYFIRLKNGDEQAQFYFAFWLVREASFLGSIAVWLSIGKKYLTQQLKRIADLGVNILPVYALNMKVAISIINYLVNQPGVRLIVIDGLLQEWVEKDFQQEKMLLREIQKLKSIFEEKDIVVICLSEQDSLYEQYSRAFLWKIDAYFDLSMVVCELSLNNKGQKSENKQICFVIDRDKREPKRVGKVYQINPNVGLNEKNNYLI